MQRGLPGDQVSAFRPLRQPGVEGLDAVGFESLVDGQHPAGGDQVVVLVLAMDLLAARHDQSFQTLRARRAIVRSTSLRTWAIDRPVCSPTCKSVRPLHPVQHKHLSFLAGQRVQRRLESLQPLAAVQDIVLQGRRVGQLDLVQAHVFALATGESASTAVLHEVRRNRK
ncbi:hypothetical protein ACRAWD_16755 [Caulobacter segnis]